MSIDVGGPADKETIAGFLPVYQAYTCPNPSSMRVRTVATKQNATATGGPQVYKNFDLTTGFICQQSDQPSGAPCLNYEVQLCCPRKIL